MFRLSNADLTVVLLDPIADRARLGARFCGGGLIWQVYTPAEEPLFTGPEWPEPAPDAFNAQGLPESFRHHSLAGHPLTWRGERGIAIGAGELAQTGDKIALTTACQWEVKREAQRVVFATQHEALGYHYQLTRTAELAGRVLRSTSHLTNLAAETIVAQWFVHPFFRLPSDGFARALLPQDAAITPNPHFELKAGQFRQTRRFVSMKDGHFDHLLLPTPEPLTAQFEHPLLGTIAFRTSFVPSSCVVWGNDRTFSLEPYLDLTLPSGTSREWSVEYEFGRAV